jgi:hypothetical protein
MVVVRSLAAEVVPGDFLLVRRRDDVAIVESVCQVIRGIHEYNLEVMWWSSPSPERSLCPERFENLQRCKAVELEPSLASTNVIHHDDVVEVVFIFSAEFLEDVWVDFAGITNVYFTRCMNHKPFSLQVSESYPSRIWSGVFSLQEKVKKMMSNRRQQQLCQKSSILFLSLDCWSYIVRRLSSVVVPLSFLKRATKVHTYSDLSMASKCTVRHLSMIRIMSPEVIAAARSVFGNTFGIGSRNDPPRRGAKKKVLEAGNKINLVNVGVVALVGRDAVKEFIPYQRIDLVYEVATRLLSIRVKYIDLLAEDSIVATVLKFPRQLSQQPQQLPRQRQRERAIVQGTSFVYNGELFSVFRSDGVSVSARNRSSSEVLNLTNTEAWQIIMSNI